MDRHAKAAWSTEGVVDHAGRSWAQQSLIAGQQARLRAEEVRPGGVLCVGTLGAVPDAAERNGVAASGRGIHRAGQAVAEGMTGEGQGVVGRALRYNGRS